MVKRTFLMRFVAAGAVALVSGALGDVSAQKGSGRPDDPAERAQNDETLMSRGEKIAWVEEQIEAAQRIYQRVQAMLEQARKEKDTIKITCLTDKLTQLEVNLQGIEERRMAFEDALSAGDSASADQQFTILKIYVSRIQSLMAEAENCIGEGDVVVGGSDVSLTIDDDITSEDPTITIDWQIGIDQPVHASAYF